jgi:uncharacterized protein YbjT (DUF2867 family)
MRSADSAEQTGDERLVLVFGASGTVGTHLVPALLRAGRQVRASSRNRKALEARFGTELCQSARKRDDHVPSGGVGAALLSSVGCPVRLPERAS